MGASSNQTRFVRGFLSIAGVFVLIFFGRKLFGVDQFLIEPKISVEFGEWAEAPHGSKILSLRVVNESGRRKPAALSVGIRELTPGGGLRPIRGTNGFFANEYVLLEAGETKTLSVEEPSIDIDWHVYVSHQRDMPIFSLMSSLLTRDDGSGRPDRIGAYYVITNTPPIRNGAYQDVDM